MLGVTGATGQLGGRIARLVAASGAEQRLVVRNPAKAPTLPGATVAEASFIDSDAVRRALDGLDTVLMVSAAESENRVEEHLTFVDAATDAGVRHLVYISFYGAAPDATFTLARHHHLTEQRIEQSGMVWTHLRDNMYADFFTHMVGDDGVIRGPAGDGRVAAVAQDDIAAAATAVLLDPARHERRTYSLTGPEGLTMADVAATLSRALGQRVSFEDETVEQAYASRSSYGAPHWEVEGWVTSYLAIAAGELAGVTGDVERLTGRPPTSLSDLLARRGG